MRRFSVANVAVVSTPLFNHLVQEKERRVSGGSFRNFSEPIPKKLKIFVFFELLQVVLLETYGLFLLVLS